MELKTKFIFCLLTTNSILMVSGSPFLSALFDLKQRIKMGIPNFDCDDAKTNLEMDWNGDSKNYTCFHPEEPFLPKWNVESKLHCDKVSNYYFPMHQCMKDKLIYNELLPTYGDHRPLWPKYGEYRFVPKERWLHNIEHGAVVMLYDPCTLESEVNKLKRIVRSCIKKHIITPTTFLSPERPMALIAWGCRLEFSVVDEEQIIQFIRAKGLNGPEGNHSKDGQYDYDLILSSAKIHGVEPNDMNDVRSKLCSKV